MTPGPDAMKTQTVASGNPAPTPASARTGEPANTSDEAQALALDQALRACAARDVQLQSEQASSFVLGVMHALERQQQSMGARAVRSVGLAPEAGSPVAPLAAQRIQAHRRPQRRLLADCLPFAEAGFAGLVLFLASLQGLAWLSQPETHVYRDLATQPFVWMTLFALAYWLERSWSWWRHPPNSA